MTTRFASLSLDLDNKWSYLKTHGDATWQDFPNYLPYAVPRILDVLDDVGVSVSFMVVGKDADDQANSDLMKEIPRRGHRVGNHSYMHEPWLHLYTRAELESELKRSEEAIHLATGVMPQGFRGPGFSLSRDAVTVLAERSYKYDATVFPNILNPLGRAYFFMKSNLSKEEKEQRKALFGTFGDALQPIQPFRWSLPSGSGLSEIPVTTMPFLRFPFHLSYLIFLAGISPWIAERYLAFALALCRLTDTSPSILIHPLDFLGKDDEPELGFFPGMGMESAKKIDLTTGFLETLSRRYSLVSLDEAADTLITPEVRDLERLAL